MSSVQSISFEI